LLVGETDEEMAGNGNGEELEEDGERELDSGGFKAEVDPEANKDEDKPEGHALAKGVTSANSVGKPQDADGGKEDDGASEEEGEGNEAV